MAIREEQLEINKSDLLQQEEDNNNNDNIDIEDSFNANNSDDGNNNNVITIESIETQVEVEENTLESNKTI